MKKIMGQLSTIRKIFLSAAMVAICCLFLTGCDREAPTLSGIDNRIEIDCMDEFNLEEYLNDNLMIADETDDGVVNYTLSELEHSVICDASIYNAETGDFSTEQFGKYNVDLEVKDESNNKANVSFTVRINPLHIHSAVAEVLEMDCGVDFNVDEYLRKNVVVQNLSETVEYNLDEFNYKIECDKIDFDHETGKLDTEAFGEYEIRLTIASESFETNQLSFIVKLNPLHMSSTVEEIVKMDCGTEFNVDDYLNQNLKIMNISESEVHSIHDFDYTIECDETVYDTETGELDTGKFGEYIVSFTINSKSFENDTIRFKIVLNPLAITKGYYVYESDISSTGYDFIGFCEYKNTSVENLKLTEIELQFFDKDGVMIGSNDTPQYSREYVASGESGYALDIFSSFNASISSPDEIAYVEVKVEFKKTTAPDTTSLQVENMEITNDYAYNMSGFAGNTVITNPYDRDVEYFTLLAGMYDAEGNLIGVMEAMGENKINANSKARATASWLPDPREIPDKVVELKASARVSYFEDN